MSVTISITKRPKARWGLPWEIDYRQPDGKRRRKRFPTKAEAENAADNLRKKFRQNTYVDPNDIGTFEEAAARQGAFFRLIRNRLTKSREK